MGLSERASWSGKRNENGKNRENLNESVFERERKRKRNPNNLRREERV